MVYAALFLFMSQFSSIFVLLFRGFDAKSENFYCSQAFLTTELSETLGTACRVINPCAA
jgi:hypothetical protein